MLQYSILVCTYNRADFLKETIQSILSHIEGKANIELVVVDNNSTDTTAEVVRQFAHAPQLRYVFEEQQGLCSARNRGIREAAHPIIVFFDDDIELDANYFTVLDKVYADPAVKIAGGKVLPYQVSIPNWLPKSLHYLASVFDEGDTPREVPKLMGANHTFRREVPEQVGGYNTNIGQVGAIKLGGDENEFLLRAQQKGYTLFYHPGLIVYHKIANRLNKPFVLKYAYNIGASEANIDYLHQKGHLLLRCAKYIAARTIGALSPAGKDDENFTKVIKTEQRRGYLETVRYFLTKS